MKKVRIYVAQRDCTSTRSECYDLCVSFNMEEAKEAVKNEIRRISEYDFKKTDMFCVMAYDVEVPDEMESAKDCYNYALEEDCLGDCVDYWEYEGQ